MIYLKKQREYAQRHHDKVTADLVSAAKAEGYREGVRAALGVIEGVFGDYCNEWAVDALGSCKSETEALLTKGENE